MDKLKTEPSEWQAANARNTLRLGGWTVAWLATLALAAFGPRVIWDYQTLPTIAAVLVNLGVGAVMILMTVRHMKGLDELQQKIMIEAAALSLGAGLVFGSSYELLEDIKLIPFEPEISHLMMLMALAYMVGIVIGQRRYR